MKPYTKFAEVYDLMGADRHSIRMTEYCQEIFKKYKINPKTGLDLCCGTGTAIARFCDLGIEMSGLDMSPHMLSITAKKLKKQNVSLYQKKLPEFTIKDNKDSTKIKTFDLVTCFYDALNYILKKNDLKKTFKSVYNHLKPGGWFIFDMNTEEALKTLWDHNVFADAKNDIGWIWKNEYNHKKGIAHIHATFFVKEGDIYNRFYEKHTERGYKNTEIKKMLRTCGYQIKGFYQCYYFEKANKDTNRFCAIVRKPLRTKKVTSKYRSK